MEEVRKVIVSNTGTEKEPFRVTGPDFEIIQEYPYRKDVDGEIVYDSFTKSEGKQVLNKTFLRKDWAIEYAKRMVEITSSLLIINVNRKPLE